MAGCEVAVVEAKRIASGQTGNTTAKITSQHGLIYDKLLHKVNMEVAEGYAQANQEALDMYEHIVEKEGIACHLKWKRRYVLQIRPSFTR